jgi:serine/threonine protein kinase/Tfp pilus assembly protein PilF
MKMTFAPQTLPPSTIRGEPARDTSARGLAADIRARWQRGEMADAAAALEHFPELKSSKSIVLDLAYEEYCLRTESGSPPDPDDFCERFPFYQASLRRLVDAHRFLDENSEYLDAGQAVEWPLPGQRFRDFLLVRELGRGAFARVYLAKEETLGDRPVAIKVSLRGGAEAQTLGRIRHPNIVSVHSVRNDERSGLTIVCMPYLGSATLCDVLDRVIGAVVPERGQAIIEAITAGRLNESEGLPGKPDPLLARRSYTDAIIHLGAQLADALACIHKMGICHRDLKPSNVLMSPEGRPMLLDFNLSFDGRGDDNRLGGTLPYMSPEQLKAIGPVSDEAAHPMDARSDIYSLGILLYELLAGGHPYGPLPLRLSSNDLRRSLLERQERRPKPLRELNSRVDAGLADLIDRCLAREPKDRPQEAQEVARALERMLSPVGRARRWGRLHPLRAAASSFLAFAVIGGVAAGAAAMHEGQAARYFREGREAAAAIFEGQAARYFREGVEAYARGDYTGAVEKLGRSLELQSDPQVLLARGRAYQRLNGIDAAITDYERSCKLLPTGEATAAAAYAHNLNAIMKSIGPEHEIAARFYQQAIGLGRAGPRIYNNLGASLIQVHRPLDALPYLDMAIRHDAGMQAAYYNRALADFESRQPTCDMSARVASVRLLGSGGPFGALAAFLVGRMENVPEDALRDIDMAIHIGPAAANLYYRKAIMCRFAADWDPSYREPMYQAIESAIRGGQPASLFGDGPLDIFRPFAQDPRFKQARSVHLLKPGARYIDRFLDPADEPLLKPAFTTSAQ